MWASQGLYALFRFDLLQVRSLRLAMDDFRSSSQKNQLKCWQELWGWSNGEWARPWSEDRTGFWMSFQWLQGRRKSVKPPHPKILSRAKRTQRMKKQPRLRRRRRKTRQILWTWTWAQIPWTGRTRSDLKLAVPSSKSSWGLIKPPSKVPLCSPSTAFADWSLPAQISWPWTKPWTTWRMPFWQCSLDFHRFPTCAWMSEMQRCIL